MVEVKADALERSFEQFEDDDDGVAALKAELETLKAKIAAGVIAAQRAPLQVVGLDGVKSAEASAFVEQYIRRWIEAGFETKAIGNSSDAIGGYAVPKEIDEVIDETLTAISPIRAIANVVKVGSAGYRKLIAQYADKGLKGYSYGQSPGLVAISIKAALAALSGKTMPQLNSVPIPEVVRAVLEKARAG